MAVSLPYWSNSIGGAVLTDCDNCCCPANCTACGDEYDLKLVFAAPYDWITINGYAMLSTDGGCTWSMNHTFTNGTQEGIISASLSCTAGKWYLRVEACLSADGGASWQSCSWVSAGRDGTCPPTGSYPLTQTEAGCTVSITSSQILAPD